MDAFIQQFQALLERHVITLGNEPIQVYQIVLLFGVLAAALSIAGFLRQWLRRLLNQFGVPENLVKRSLAFLFLIVL